jgi:hypothetical protein
MALDPASLWGGLWAPTRPATPCGLWASSMKKNLAGLPVWQGLPIPNARVHISIVPNVKAIMGLQDI